MFIKESLQISPKSPNYETSERLDNAASTEEIYDFRELFSLCEFKELKAAISAAASTEEISLYDFKELKATVCASNGGYGEIYKAYLSHPEKGYIAVALKCPHQMSKDSQYFDFVIREIQHLKKVKHPNIVEFFGLSIDAECNRRYIVFEWADDGCLKDYIESNHLYLNWPRRIQMAREISAGIAYLHSQDILHRDLNLENILVKNGRMLITGFGIFVNNYSKTNINVIHTENLCYSEPQNFLTDEGGYVEDKRSDIYALGIILWQVSSGRRFAIAIAGIIRGIREKIEPGTPEKYQELYTKCWDNDPEKRPIAEEICFTLTELSKEFTVLPELHLLTNTTLIDLSTTFPAAAGPLNFTLENFGFTSVNTFDRATLQEPSTAYPDENLTNSQTQKFVFINENTFDRDTLQELPRGDIRAPYPTYRELQQILEKTAYPDGNLINSLTQKFVFTNENTFDHESLRELPCDIRAPYPTLWELQQMFENTAHPDGNLKNSLTQKFDHDTLELPRDIRVPYPTLRELQQIFEVNKRKVLTINGYFLFRKKYADTLRKLGYRHSMKSISGLSAKAWKLESNERRERFSNLAKEGSITNRDWNLSPIQPKTFQPNITTPSEIPEDNQSDFNLSLFQADEIYGVIINRR